MQLAVAPELDPVGLEPGEEEPGVESDGRVRGSDRPAEVDETPERRCDTAAPHLVEVLPGALPTSPGAATMTPVSS